MREKVKLVEPDQGQPNGFHGDLSPGETSHRSAALQQRDHGLANARIGLASHRTPRDERDVVPGSHMGMDVLPRPAAGAGPGCG